MVVVVPLSLLGQTPSAILHSQGGVWVNGYEAKDSAAVFAGDTLETRPEFSAKLSLEGSGVSIQPESLTKFQGDLIELTHGGVSVGTSTRFKVKVKCITVTPVLGEWTQYDVTDVNGNVQVAAIKNDVNVEITKGLTKPSAESAQSSGGTVHEGEQHSYNESDVCGAPARFPNGASPLNAKWIEIGGATLGGVLVCLILLCKGSGSSPHPMSASQP